jgi:hypothetical protein
MRLKRSLYNSDVVCFRSAVCLLAFQPVGCAAPLEISDFRYIGESVEPEDHFYVDRDWCESEAPPIPLVEVLVYQECMARQ